VILERLIPMTSAAAPLTTIILAPPNENFDSEAARVYRLRKRFAVVHFDPEAKGRIVFLPEGAEIRVAGPSALSKCVEVRCGNQLYNIFQEDLLGPWSIPVRSSRRGMVRVKGVEACA
jgi:hypothetical protein